MVSHWFKKAILPIIWLGLVFSLFGCDNSHEYFYGGSGSSVVNPKLPVSGAVLWLRADMGVVKDSSGRVYLWEDQSGSGNHAGGSASWLSAGINGHIAIGFDGVSDHFIAGTMSGTSFSGGLSIFAVVRNTDAGDAKWRAIVEKRTTGVTVGFGLLRASAVTDYRFQINGTAGATNTTGVATGDTVLLAAINENATNNSLYLNGTLSATVGSAAIIDSTSNLTIGIRSVSSDSFKGQIGEIVIYNKTLTASERKKVECDLAGRFGLTVSGC